MKMAMESMEMAPGKIPRPGRVPEQDLLTPETRFRWWRHDGTFRGRWSMILGFSRQEGINRPRYDGLGHPWAPHHFPARLEVGPRHQVVWRPRGSPPSPLWTPCTCRENRNLAFRFVQFQEYFLCNFCDTKNSRKHATGTVASC